MEQATPEAFSRQPQSPVYVQLRQPEARPSANFKNASLSRLAKLQNTADNSQIVQHMSARQNSADDYNSGAPHFQATQRRAPLPPQQMQRRPCAWALPPAVMDQPRRITYPHDTGRRVTQAAQLRSTTSLTSPGSGQVMQMQGWWSYIKSGFTASWEYSKTTAILKAFGMATAAVSVLWPAVETAIAVAKVHQNSDGTATGAVNHVWPHELAAVGQILYAFKNIAGGYHIGAAIVAKESEYGFAFDTFQADGSEDNREAVYDARELVLSLRAQQRAHYAAVVANIAAGIVALGLAATFLGEHGDSVTGYGPDIAGVIAGFNGLIYISQKLLDWYNQRLDEKPWKIDLSPDAARGAGDDSMASAEYASSSEESSGSVVIDV